MCFVSLCFLNERNIATSLLMNDVFKMYCCSLKLHKQAVFKLRAVEYAISFVPISCLYFFKDTHRETAP